MGAGEIVAIVLASIIFVLIVVFLSFLPKRVYLGAIFSGVYVSAFTLVGMRFRKVKLQEIVGAYTLAKKSKLKISLFDLELISTSGGHPLNVVEGMNAAKMANLNISFDFAKAIDIGGYDIVQVVKECLNPFTFELPLVTAVSRDKFEVNAKISVTLKVNLNSFLKGVAQETISARGVEAAVANISNCDKAADLVAKPEILDKAIVSAGIDEGSKYEVVSVDVLLIDLGKNIGAEIEKENIEKNRVQAVNQLEQRRLSALAVEQEMKAKVAANDAESSRLILKSIEEGKIIEAIELFKLTNAQNEKKQTDNKAGGED